MKNSGNVSECLTRGGAHDILFTQNKRSISLERPSKWPYQPLALRTPPHRAALFILAASPSSERYGVRGNTSLFCNIFGQERHTMKKKGTRLLALLLAAMMVLTACGGGGEPKQPDTTDTPLPPPTERPRPPPRKPPPPLSLTTKANPSRTSSPIRPLPLRWRPSSPCTARAPATWTT